jgi:hypothetical protein
MWGGLVAAGVVSAMWSFDTLGLNRMSLAFKRFLRVFVAIAAWLFLDFCLGYLASVLFNPDPFAGIGFLTTAVLLAFLGVNLLTPILLMYCRHKRRNIWLREEAERWLAARSAKPITPAKRRLQKLRRGMLWVPSIFALWVLLFLPESWGIASHIVEGGSVNLNGNRIAIPLTWVITSNGNISGQSFAQVLVGRGIGRVGFIPYLRREELIAHLSLHGLSYDQRDHGYSPVPRNANILSSRTVAFGTESLFCSDIAYGKGPRLDSDQAEIYCATPASGIVVYFYGSRTLSNEFYGLLERVTQAQ